MTTYAPPRDGTEEKPDIELLRDMVAIAEAHHRSSYGTHRLNALRRAIANLEKQQ